MIVFRTVTEERTDGNTSSITDKKSMVYQFLIDKPEVFRKGIKLKTGKKAILGIAAFLIVFLACALLVVLPKTALGEEAESNPSNSEQIFYPTYVREGYTSMIEWKKDVKDYAEATVVKGQNILNNYKEYFSEEERSELQAVIDRANISNCFARLNEYSTELDSWKTKGQENKKIAEEKAAAEAKAAAAKKNSASAPSSGNSKTEYQKAVSSGYSGSYKDFLRAGVVYSNGNKFTYYSQRVLPGGGLKIPGRHTEGGFVKDADGYIVVANSKANGTVVDTPFGAGKVYDKGTSNNHYDIYVE